MASPRGGAGATFDEIADAFDATRDRPWPFVERWMDGLGALGGPLLDVGCGNGHHLALARTQGIAFVGIDASARLLSLAAPRLGGPGRLVLSDARRLAIRTGSAGAVMAVALLHHVPRLVERREAVAEMARVARPGAPILVSTWALDEPRVAARAGARPDPDSDEGGLLVPWRAGRLHPIDRRCSVVTGEELAALLGEAGLMVEISRDEGANHVVQARRPA